MRTHTHRLVVSLGLLALVLGIAWASAQESEEMQIVRAAEQLVQQQKPDEALAELDKIFEQTDSFAPAYFVAGLAYAAKGEAEQAFDNFVSATEYQPGWGMAHRMASMYAADMNDLEASWDHAIKAHLAGTDMSDAFEGLQTMGPAPEDLEMRLSARRIWVAPMNVEKYLAHTENPFGRAVSPNADTTNPDNVSNTKATGVGARVINESAADRASVMRRTRQRLADSRFFGLVNQQDQAQYLLVVEAEEIGENNTNRPLEGNLILLDARSGEQTHRIRFRMSNIASESAINRDLDRIIGLLEDWAEKELQ